MGLARTGDRFPRLLAELGSTVVEFLLAFLKGRTLCPQRFEIRVQRASVSVECIPIALLLRRPQFDAERSKVGDTLGVGNRQMVERPRRARGLGQPTNILCKRSVAAGRDLLRSLIARQ
jgi:hypothetical protein